MITNTRFLNKRQKKSIAYLANSYVIRVDQSWRLNYSFNKKMAYDLMTGFD